MMEQKYITTMKFKSKIIAYVLIAITLFGLFGSFVQAQAQEMWYLQSGKLRPNVNSWGLRVPSLNSSGTDCLQVDSIGVISSTGSVCAGLSPLTTKGDLYTFSTVDARLGVGTNGQVLKANSASTTGLEWSSDVDTGITQLTGDITAGPGSSSQVATLATVNGNVGSFGSATQVGTFTVNGKGLITAASNTTITPNFTNVLGGTAGSVIFSNGTTLAQDNANFFWDDTNNRLGLGTTAPGAQLQVNAGSASTIGTIIKAAASQTANLTEWQNSSGTALSVIDELGHLGLGTSAPSASTLLHVSGTGQYGTKFENTTTTSAVSAYFTNTTNALYIGVESSAGSAVGAGVPYAGVISSSEAYPLVFLTDATARLTIGATGLVGIATTAPAHVLHIKPVLTSQTTGVYGILTDHDITQTADVSTVSSIAATFRLRGSVNQTSTSTGHSASVLSAFNSNTATVSFFSGERIDVRNLSTGTVTHMHGIYIPPMANSGGGTVTNTYGLRISDQTVGTNNYGISSAVSSGSNKYNIYASGTAQNYFAGDVGIGQTSPTAVLHLKAGTATASTAPLKFTSGTLNTTAEAGAVEFLTDAFYGTITTGATRKTFAFLESPTFTGTLTAPTIVSSTVVRLKNYTVATLPAGTQGDTAFVTDALAPTFLAAVVGGGAVVTPVFYNGTVWVSH